MRLTGSLQRGQRTLLAASAIMIGLALAVAPATTAHAAGTLHVSDDGIIFGPTYSGVLFDGIAKIVPGDSQTEIFYLRNIGPDDGFLRLTLQNVSGDTAFFEGLSLSTSAPTHSGAFVGLDKASPCWVLNEGVFMAAGDTIVVTARLAFDSASGNVSKNSLADFDVVASITDTAVALPPTECGGSGITVPGSVPRPSGLSYTGGDVPVMLVIVTAFIVGAGLFLVVAARRRRHE